jgi:transcriptional regulator with XRE-family HTH domain
MSFYALGSEIKMLRRVRGFSQKELSEGICSQAQISKIEKGDVYPLASTLYEISNRLGVDINYFFDRALVERFDYIEEVYLQVREAVNNYEYRNVKEIVDLEMRNPLYHNHLEFKQFIMWHEGVCKYHNDNLVAEAIALIDQAFKLSHTNKYYSEREIEIMNSKGIIQFLNGDTPTAIELYLELIHHQEKLKCKKDITINIRLHYNLAKVLNKEKNYKDSITTCENCIKYCIRNNNMYLFGHLHFQVGYNYYQMEQYDKADPYFRKAHTIFDLQYEHKLKDHIDSNFLVSLN